MAVVFLNVCVYIYIYVLAYIDHARWNRNPKPLKPKDTKMEGILGHVGSQSLLYKSLAFGLLKDEFWVEDAKSTEPKLQT